MSVPLFKLRRVGELVVNMFGPVLVVLVTAAVATVGRVNRLRHIERLAEIAGKFPEGDEARDRLLMQGRKEADAEVERLGRTRWYEVAAYWIVLLVVTLLLFTSFAVQDFDTPEMAKLIGGQVAEIRSLFGISTPAAITVVALSRVNALVVYAAFALLSWKCWRALRPDIVRRLQSIESPRLVALDKVLEHRVQPLVLLGGAMLPVALLFYLVFTLP